MIDIDGIEIPCVSKPDQHRSTPCNVTAVGETILPPKSENILVGKVAGMHNTPNTVIIEPNRRFERSARVKVASSANEIQDGTVIIRILNPSPAL